MELCNQNSGIMKRNTQAPRLKTRTTRNKTLPLLRGMFIFPESLKWPGNMTGTEILSDEFNQFDHFQPSGREQIQGQKEKNWTVSEEGLSMSIS